PTCVLGAARDDREVRDLAVIEQVAPFFSDRGGIAQVLLVHHLHEGGVVGAEDEFAHGGKSNCSAFASRCSACCRLLPPKPRAWASCATSSRGESPGRPPRRS